MSILDKRKGKYEDKSFIYNLLKENMIEFFNKYTKEGWSSEKFERGFSPENINIIEEEDKPIGFLETKLKTNGDGKNYLYISNLQLKLYKRGNLYFVEKLIREQAKINKVNIVRAKVFLANKRTLKLTLMRGYYIKENISDESSVLVEKKLE